MLILYIVGSTSRSYIGAHKRLREYDEADYDLLLGEIEPASEVLVTPNSLTETSNLIKNIGDPAKSEIFQSFKMLIERSTERYVESRAGAAQPEFVRLGLTDSVLLSLTDSSITLLTVDSDLYQAAARRGDFAINFNHLRDSRTRF